MWGSAYKLENFLLFPFILCSDKKSDHFEYQIGIHFSALSQKYNKHCQSYSDPAWRACLSLYLLTAQANPFVALVY